MAPVPTTRTVFAPSSKQAEAVWLPLAGHGATIHAATIKDGSLVGMGAILLDGVTVRCSCIGWPYPVSCVVNNLLLHRTTQVESGAIVAAGAVVSPGRTVPSGEVWAGAPAKRLRALEPEEAGFLAQAASDYAALAAVHAAENAKSLEEILARPNWDHSMCRCCTAFAGTRRGLLRCRAYMPSCIGL